jgi:hypothetical protein
MIIEMLKNAKRKISLALAMLVLFATGVFAQAVTDNVGIGTIAPHPSAKLEIAENGSPKKGLLIPRVNQVQLLNMEGQYPVDGLADGLMVYELQQGKFWYYKYDSPVPPTPPYGTWVEIATGTQANNSNVPSGGIIMYSGLNSDIPGLPGGWSLCDGSNGTPDLTDKFILSVSSAAENPGTGPVPSLFVDVEPGATVSPDRRIFKLAYIMKL